MNISLGIAIGLGFFWLLPIAVLGIKPIGQVGAWLLVFGIIVGFAGGLTNEVKERERREMLDAMRHRGDRKKKKIRR